MTASNTVPDGDVGTARGSDKPGPVAPFLFTLLECQRPAAGGSRHALTNVEEVLFSRGKARTAERTGSKLTLRIPDRWMSSTHARLVRGDQGWVIDDLGSLNGTFVDGERVTHAEVGEGVLELGHTLFLLDLSAFAVPTADYDSEFVPRNIAGLLTLKPALSQRFDALARLAGSAVPILLLGETGTGKEVLAQAVHRLSGRAGAFVAVNCGAIADTLIESELFGHARGAFSGAIRDAPGLIRSAEGGTLFLDEIGDLSLRSQAALLRVLQEREVLAVGTTRPVNVDVRIVAATHRSLDDLVTKGQFRTDLYARLAGLSITLPPLRDRREDLGIIVADIFRKLEPEREMPRTFALDAGRALALYDWPHNIRELFQSLQIATALAGEGPVLLSHLPDAIAAGLYARYSSGRQAIGADADPQKVALIACLEESKGNVSEVARAMGKARMQIHRWIRRYGLNPESYRK